MSSKTSKKKVVNHTVNAVPSLFSHTIKDTNKLGTRKFVSKKKYIKPDIDIGKHIVGKDADLAGFGDVIKKVKKEDVHVPSGAIRKHKMVKQLSGRFGNRNRKKSFDIFARIDSAIDTEPTEAAKENARKRAASRNTSDEIALSPRITPVGEATGASRTLSSPDLLLTEFSSAPIEDKAESDETRKGASQQKRSAKVYTNRDGTSNSIICGHQSMRPPTLFAPPSKGSGETVPKWKERLTVKERNTPIANIPDHEPDGIKNITGQVDSGKKIDPKGIANQDQSSLDHRGDEGEDFSVSISSVESDEHSQTLRNVVSENEPHDSFPSNRISVSPSNQSSREENKMMEENGGKKIDETSMLQQEQKHEIASENRTVSSAEHLNAPRMPNIAVPQSPFSRNVYSSLSTHTNEDFEPQSVTAPSVPSTFTARGRRSKISDSGHSSDDSESDSGFGSRPLERALPPIPPHVSLAQITMARESFTSSEIICSEKSLEYAGTLIQRVKDTKKKLEMLSIDTKHQMAELRMCFEDGKQSMRLAFEQKISAQRILNQKQGKQNQRVIDNEKKIVEALRVENKRLRATIKKLPRQIVETQKAIEGIETTNEEIGSHFDELRVFTKKLQIDHDKLLQSSFQCRDEYLPRYRSELRERQSLMNTETKIKGQYRDCTIRLAKYVEKSRGQGLADSINEMVLETEASVNPKFDPKILFASDSDSSSSVSDGSSDSSDDSSDSESS